jgi:hypothetical protein
MSYPEVRILKTATIANGVALSDEVDLTGLVVIGIEMPAAWTSADLTFQGGNVSGSLGEVYEDDAAYQRTAAAGRKISLGTVNPLLPWRFLKARSGTSGTPVNQAAERAIKLVCRPV